nr:hypothetical protein [Tanacetum cinerariifolium]
MTSLADKAILSGVDNLKENGVTKSKIYSELSTTEAIQADCDVEATNIILQGLPPEVYVLGESLRDFYLRFSLLLNDMNIYNMKLEQFQVNTKFLNTLPPEWSKFVTDVKLVRDLHTTNVDQLHVDLGQHEYHANEYVLQVQSSTSLSITYPSNDFQSSVNHNVYNPSSSIPQMEYAPAAHQQSEFFQPDIGLVVLMGQNSITAGMSRQYTLGPSGTLGKQRLIVCYNCKGEGHMSKQYTKPKWKRDEVWFKEKRLKAHSMTSPTMLLIKPMIWILMTLTVMKLILPRLLSWRICLTIDPNLAEDNKNINEFLTVKLERYKDQVRILNEQNNVNKASESCAQSLEINNLKHILSEHLKEKESLEQKVTLLKNNFQKEESRNIDRELALEKQVKELNNILFKRNQPAQTVHMLTKPQFFYDHSTRQALGFQNPCYLKRAQQLEPKLYDGSVI